MVDTLPLDKEQHILSFDNAVNTTFTSNQIPFQQLMARLATQMSQAQFAKFRTFLASPDFLRRISDHQQSVQLKSQLANPIRNVQNILKDVIGMNLTPDDIQTIVKFSQNISNQLTSPQKSAHVHTGRKITSRQNDQLSMSPGTNESFYYSHSRHQDNKSILSIDSFTTQSRTSTTFSKPFTSYSFVSSTTAGTNLTLKIERMNRATIKLLAKQFIQCQGQLEQSLKNAKLTMKSKLTISEMQMYLAGTDLQSVQLTSLQNLLVAALLIQQPNSQDILLSYKQLIAGCHNYIEQCDIEGKDVFNKTKFDKIMDDIRDFVYLKSTTLHQQQNDCKQMFMKYAEAENPEQMDRVVITKDQFLKLCKHIVGEKYSSREIEQVYRNLVSKKPLNLKRFFKIFIHKPVEDIWWPTGLRIFREYMMRKKLEMESAFARFVLGQNKQVNKKLWREAVRKEVGISLNMVQIDYIFDKIDHSREGFIDLQKWIDTFKDEAINPIQLLRELVLKNQMTADDILYRLKKRLSDPPMTVKQFKECLLRIDSSLTQGQLRSLYEQLAIKRETFTEPLVEVPHLLKALITDKPYEQDTIRRDIGKKISEYIISRADVYQVLKTKLEGEDSEHDGYVMPERLIKVLISCIKVVYAPDIEKYVNTLDRDQRGRINYQKLILKLENPRNNFPLKALAVRLTVFMQQNAMTAKSLLDKLIETKNSSKTNKARNKATSDQITTNFFAKFIKAKVDKKRTLEELKDLVDRSIDMDKDGFIGLSDLEAFVGRASYHQFFERLPTQSSTNNNYYSIGSNTTIKRGSIANPTDTQLHTIKQLQENLKKISSQNKIIMQKEIAKVEESQLYPISERPQSDDQQLELLGSLLHKLRQAMLAKGLKTLPQAFSLMDPESLGLVSFPAFSAGLDKITKISDQGKQQLFMKLDKLGIGMFSYDQFKKLLSTADGVALRLYDKDVKPDDKFEWEQNVIRQLLDWILDKRVSLADAFKIMDINFDGVIQLQDLQQFLRDTFNIDINRYRLNVERLFKIMDLSKSGSIFMVDFKNMFTKVFKQESQATLGGIKRAKSALQKFSKSSAGFVINWQESCIEQISRYLHDNYQTIQDSFNALTKTPGDGSQRMMKANEFLEFIQSKQILKGFNLTKELLYKLFAKLDTLHRKGYLILQDWVNSFGKEQDGMDELKRAMGQAFTSSDDMLQFLRTRGFDETTITKEGFNRLLDHLLPNKFSASQKDTLWKALSNDQESTPVHQFLQYFSSIPFRPQNALTTQVAKHLQRTNFNDLDQLLGIEPTMQPLSPSKASVAQIGLIVDKLRRMLKTRGISDIRALFNGSDTCNLVEFKNSIKKIGLQNKEIEKLYEGLTPGEPNEYTGMIDLKMLADKIARVEFYNSLIEKKAAENLKEFKELLIKHMNSIEDAFYLYDSGNKGKQTFEDFQKLVSHVYVTCDRRDLPNPVILRDLFDTIDLKKDGLLDFYEWRHSFQLNKFNQREEFLFGRQINDQQREQQTSYPNSWPKNKVYYEFLTYVAKNRKPLVQMYQRIEDMPGYVDFDLGVAAFIKYIRETLNVSPKQYSDLYLQEMIKPFGELKHGQRMLNYVSFTDTLKKRHYLVREAVNNRHAALPKAMSLSTQ